MKNVVVMFPYPSGDGLHLGHVYNYAVIDSYCRWLRYNGEKVLQPFGYDAFGLPAENYARKIGGDPGEVTYGNITKFRKQMDRMNTEYKERLITSDPSYVKWTQWLFTQLYNRGLAYKAEGEVNWCQTCGTVLANEQCKPFDPQFLNGPQKCERCDLQIQKKVMNQWYFKITDYKDRLMKNLFAAPGEPNYIDYPASTKKQQAAWIENLRDWCVSRQRKWGCPIPFPVEEDTLDTFVDSSFYFLRYLTDSQNEFLPKGSYRPVDLYVGGPEHACMHLIYSRFIHMVLYDMGIVPQEEPFNKLVHQGMITRHGNKMSKRFGNAVSPDDYDPDILRMHLMFIGPYDVGGDWNDKHISGIERFLRRMAKWLSITDGTDAIDIVHLETKIGHEIARLKFNRVISSLMEFYNANKGRRPTTVTVEKIERLLRVFAPSFEKSKWLSKE